MTSIPIGDSRFDNIPVLNEQQFQPSEKRLPDLNIPQTDSELSERIDALLARFTTPTLTIERSTPGRLLRYSLVGGADDPLINPRRTGGRQVPSAAARDTRRRRARQRRSRR